ncbi:MAG: hypothetical protein LBT00_15810, partial [Spirochaetaceae bacterium]|nr:hypothetical protein [Spirochaetaceae bacterium]
AVGYGAGRQAAESNAIGSLTAFFKQSVTSRISIADTERETGGRSVSESNMSQSIEAVSALDKLIGAEIKAVWNDTGKRLWYALAVMEKAKCQNWYAAELDKAKSEISALINLSGGVTFESIARCRKARSLAGEADVYALVLSLLDGPNRQDEVSRLVLRVDAALNEAKAIPVDVRVTGDVNGRLKAAFAGAFTAEGFKTGSRNSRYALEAALTLTPAPKNVYFNTRYTVDAVLRDTQTGAELFTYNAANRESHPASQEEANNRVISGAQRKITEEFPAVLREYLDGAE